MMCYYLNVQFQAKGLIKSQYKEDNVVKTNYFIY